MNKKQLLRLAALIKAQADNTALKEAEQAEYDALVTAAKAADIELTAEAVEKAAESADDSDNDDADAVSSEELKSLIADAVKDSNSVDADELAEKLAASLGSKSKGADKEAIAKAVKEALPDFKQANSDLTDSIVESIASKMPQSQAIDYSRFGKELGKSLSEYAAEIRGGSSMKHQDPHSNVFPIEHRSGNMDIGTKQLYNVTMAAAENAGHLQGAPKHINDGISDDQLKTAETRGKQQLLRLREQKQYGKGLTTDGAGTGAEFVPCDLSTNLMYRMYCQSQIAAAFIASEVDMPSNPFRFPLATTRPQFFTGAEHSCSDTDCVTCTDPGTGELILDAKKLIGCTCYSYEIDEDGIIAMLPFLTERLASGAADALEGTILNGDVTNPHMDADSAAVPNHHTKLFTGLRKYALAGGLGVDLSASGVTEDSISSMRKCMKKYGMNPSELMLIAGPCAYSDLVALEKVCAANTIGSASRATINSGTLDSIFGIDIVVSSQNREDLNASGVFDGVDTSKGSLLLVHRPSWILGVKRGFMVEVDVDKKCQVNTVIASFRRDFKPMEPVNKATSPTVVLGYNYNAM